MFDLQAEDGSVRRKPYRSPIPQDSTPPASVPVSDTNLDSEEAQEEHGRLLDTYVREVDRQRDNRAEMATDEDFYDNEQWSKEDIATLRDRGQVPLVYNVISASVDWVTGTERRGRTDHKVLPRRKEGAKPAERKTELMKYLSDVNRSPFEMSRGFEDAVKVGIGWIEDAIDDDGSNEPIVRRHESWRNMLWDSTCQRLDMSDARYQIRAKWIDMDIALAIFPQRASLIERSADKVEDFLDLEIYGDDAMDQMELEYERDSNSLLGNTNLGYQRDRVRIMEMWYRKPVMVTSLRGSEFSGEIFDPNSRGHRWALDRGKAEHHQMLSMRMHCALFTPQGFLWRSVSPYRHNRFPFTAIWGYRRGRNGLPYGMIRRLRDIQEDVNKRASKALHILSTNKVIMDEGALPEGMSLEDFQEEAARPDAVLLKKPGTEMILGADRQLMPAHLDLMSRSIAMIQQSSGVTDENLGRRTNATSGIAIQRRQDQGALATMKFFDHLLMALQLAGEKQLSLIEQFMGDEKQFRITNSRGTPEYVTINDALPENDITATKADFIIAEQDWQASMREAAAAELMEVMKTLPPQVALTLLDLVVENMDLRNREEIVKRIRQVTGQRDPDAEEPTPEEQAQMQQAAEDAQLQRAGMRAEVEEKAAKAAKALAEARKAMAGIPGVTVDAQNKALEAAIKAMSAPGVADAADLIMHEAGFISRSDQEQQGANAAHSPQDGPAEPAALPPPQHDNPHPIGSQP
ncbi:hypothetical protein [Oricola sp.]|uniref:portal protein n=1 Tax=Oricola sp. TaxID=1979950 RepID=UPI003BAB4CFC